MTRRLMLLMVGLITAFVLIGCGDTGTSSTANSSSDSNSEKMDKVEKEEKPKKGRLTDEEQIVVDYYEMVSIQDAEEAEKVEEFIYEHIFSFFAPITYNSWLESAQNGEIVVQDASIMDSVEIQNFDEEYPEALAVLTNLEKDNGDEERSIVIFVEEEGTSKIVNIYDESSFDSFNEYITYFGEEPVVEENTEKTDSSEQVAQQEPDNSGKQQQSEENNTNDLSEEDLANAGAKADSYYEEDFTEDYSEEYTEQYSEQGLVLIDHNYGFDDFSEYVYGSIMNDSSAVYDYAEVEISLLDENGALLGTTFDNITNLQPGQTWNFEAMVLTENVAYYEIIDIYGTEAYDDWFSSGDSGLTLIDHEYVHDGFWGSVVGTIQNDSGWDYEYAEVNVNFYDDDGNLVESSFDNITNLRAGQQWKFEVLMTSENVATYEIMSMDGW